MMRFGHFGSDFGAAFLRMRRGDVKYLLLEVLKEQPRHGYEIISEVEGRTGYRPSPGSIYPTLQMLEDGGFLTSEQVDGKKVYSVTDAGLKMFEERGSSVFEEHPRMKHGLEMKQSLLKLHSAAMQAVRDSDEETIAQIAEIVDRARREVYVVLAES